MISCVAAFIVLASVSNAQFAASSTRVTLRDGLRSDLNDYLAKRALPEHISALSLSVSLPGTPSTINVAVGRTQFGGRGSVVTPQNLYQIGSNTKAFTAVALLQLEAEGKLSIDQTVGKWLPQYPAWRTVSIRRLLNMTSDIPTYDDVFSMLAAYAAHPTRRWTADQLVRVVYPKVKPNAGWLYSNTAYILSQMIIERATGDTYTSQINKRFINNPALGLRSTYYQPHLYPASVTSQMVSGYFFSNDPDNAGLAPLLGKDVHNFSVSWAQGAGGIVSSPQDVTRWSRALYEGPLLPAKQRRELMTLVSQATGKPIAAATAKEHGFGLGVGQLFTPQTGLFWFYEGETLGYRMVYAYLPKSGAVVALGLNSQPPKKEDHVGQLMMAIFTRLRSAGKI